MFILTLFGSYVAVSEDMELNSKNFHVGVGSILEPCGERLVVIRQILVSTGSISIKELCLSGYRRWG